MTSAPSGPFVRRRNELAALDRALEDVGAGRGRVVLLTGEAGIGKTSTADELARRARQRDFDVLFGRCHEEAGAPAYWPWLQILRAYATERSPAALRAVLGANASDIVPLLPELSAQLPDLSPSPPLEPSQACFRLFDGVSSLVKRASCERRLLLVLEDLHWADASSLLLLRFLVREIADSPVLLVGTYRDDEVGAAAALADVLGEIVRHGHVGTLALAGLADADVTRLGMTDTYWSRGPIGRAPETLSTSLGQRVCVTITFDHKGRLIATCSNLTGPRLYMLDPATLDVLAEMALAFVPPPPGQDPFTNSSGGAYFYLDNREPATRGSGRPSTSARARRCGSSWPGRV